MGLEFAGKTFGGYRVGDILDSGPHAVLHVAEHTSSGDKVAIKIFATDLSRDKNAAARLVSDVQRAVAVSHPNIHPVREVGTAEFKGKRHLFVAMERLPGESLKSLIAKQKGQPVPMRQALHILCEVGAALDAIQRGNGVHRMLHSGAVFVGPSDAEADESRVVVLHLGAALVPTGDDKKAKTGGKLHDDLRALAQLAYEMLGGGEPASDAILPLRLRNRAVPARMDAVLRSVLGDSLGTGDSASRYDSAAAFVAALLGTGEAQPRFASWSEDGRTFPAPKKSHSTLLWAGLFAIAGGLALGYFLFSGEPSGQPGTVPQPVPPSGADRAGTEPARTSASVIDAGSDAGSGKPVGPGHWPQRPGGKIPEVRAADIWPAPAAAPAAPLNTPAAQSAATAAPTAKDPAKAQDPASGAAKPAGAAPAGAAGMPSTNTAPAAKPTSTAASSPASPPGAKSSAGSASPGGAGSVGSTPSPAPTTPAAKTTAGAAASSAAAPAAKPVSGVSPANSTAAATAKPAAAASAAAPSATPAAKPVAAPSVSSPASKPVAAPSVSSPASKPVAAPSVSSPASKPVAAPSVSSPASKPAAAPATTAPTGAAKPVAGTGSAAPGVAASTPRSSSAPAAPAGAASAAKNPETRPSSTGGSAPAAKPATAPGGASGPQ